jgi:cobalt/nickel transport system permease protein
MHMGNELLTLPVAGGFYAAAGAAIAYASVRARKELDERRVPLLGVLGAFVFAAQMVNFPVLPGTSGHFVGGALLAIVLGPHAAALGMAAIVIVQCLVFQDGGLIALGCNLVNMALVGPYAGYWIYRAIVPKDATPPRARLYAASFVAALGSILAGAILVPIQVALSGVSQVPFFTFLGTTAGVHVLIGAAEGAITFAVLAALARMRADLVPGLRAGGGFPVKSVALSVVGAALLVGAFLSLAASGSPDGLEWTLEERKVIAEEPNPAAEAAEHAGEKIAILPDYNRPEERWYWTTVSGILGSILVLGVAYAVGRALRRSPPAPKGQSG